MNCNIFREIQNPPKFWKFEGLFLGMFFGLIIFCMILTVLIYTWYVKLLILIIGTILSFILQYYSKKNGVRGMKKIIGERQQPKLIIATDPCFFLGKKATRV